MLETVVTIVLSLGGVIGAIFAIRKGWGWLFPIRVSPGVRVQFAGRGPDEILATVTNRSSEPVYLVKCRGRSANSIGHIMRTYLRHPRIMPGLYENVRFGAPVYEMIEGEPIFLAPGQPIQLSHKLSFESPLFAFTNPMVQVEVVLSNGRICRSKRLEIPARWHVSEHIRKKKAGCQDNT